MKNYAIKQNQSRVVATGTKSPVQLEQDMIYPCVFQCMHAVQTQSSWRQVVKENKIKYQFDAHIP